MTEREISLIHYKNELLRKNSTYLISGYLSITTIVIAMKKEFYVFLQLLTCPSKLNQNALEIFNEKR